MDPLSFQYLDQNIDQTRVLITLGWATGVRIVPTSFLDAYYPGGTEQFIAESTSEGRTPVIIGPLLLKPLGPIDGDEYRLEGLGFVPEVDFTWLGAKDSEWFSSEKEYFAPPNIQFTYISSKIAPSKELQASSPLGTAKWLQSRGLPLSSPTPDATRQTDFEPWAIIDASLLYGSSRILSRLHDDPWWQYRSQYRREDDQALFLEFLHALILYRKIILDNSSVDEIGDEINYLIKTVNASSNDTTIEVRKIGDDDKTRFIAENVCRLINQLPNKYQLLQIQVPWAYHQSSHYDYLIFRGQIEPEFQPIATFAYRGLCYAGYARELSRTQQNPTVYVAAAGRLAAIEPLVNSRAMQFFDFPKREYADLIQHLDLPASGFDFDYLSGTFPDYEISKLRQAIRNLNPDQALQYVMNLRTSEGVKQLRLDWQDRILQNLGFAAVGPMVSQSVRDNTVYGDLIQTIYIRAR